MMLVAALMMILAPTGAWAGEVTGKVELTTSPSNRKRGPEFRGREPRYANLRVSPYSKGRPDSDDGPSQQDLQSQDEYQAVVVELLDSAGRLPSTPLLVDKSSNAMTQKNKNFLPHVVVVPKGSRVFFHNEDPFMHDIYSKHHKDFEIPEHDRVIPRSQQFDEAGVAELFCGLHPRMNAYVYVSHSNFAGKLNKNREYRFTHVPPGKYRLRVWHPRHAEQTLEITVPEQGTAKRDVSL